MVWQFGVCQVENQFTLSLRINAQNQAGLNIQVNGQSGQGAWPAPHVSAATSNELSEPHSTEKGSIVDYTPSTRHITLTESEEDDIIGYDRTSQRITISSLHAIAG